MKIYKLVLQLYATLFVPATLLAVALSIMVSGTFSFGLGAVLIIKTLYYLLYFGFQNATQKGNSFVFYKNMSFSPSHLFLSLFVIDVLLITVITIIKQAFL